MKTRNLLLAGLAAFAMASCSSNDEFVDNQGQTGEKNALMNFGITFPSTNVRDTEVGLPSEQEFSSATVIVEYATGGKDVTVIPRANFIQNGTAALYTKDKITVQKGNAQVYVVLNATPTIADALNGESWKTGTYNTSNYIATSLKGLGDITGIKNFLMSGKSETINFTENASTDATVKVSRVAAKLEEQTTVDQYYEVAKNSDNSTLVGAVPNVKVQVKIVDYSYANLQKTSYVFPQTEKITAELFQDYQIGAFHFQPITGLKKVEGVENVGDITYCLENFNAKVSTVLYKAKVQLSDGQDFYDATAFWVDRDNVIFTSFAQLVVKYPSIKETTSISECWTKFGIRKYVDGTCYYKAEIKTDATRSEIVRNNVYKLKVTDITKLGLPEPKDEPELTTLKLSVSIEPWTVQINDIIL